MTYKIKTQQKTDDSFSKLTNKLIALEFDKTEFPTLKSIKKWFQKNIKKYGVTFNFLNKEFIFDEEETISLQVNDVYREPIAELKTKLEDGVTFVYHLNLYKLKADDKSIPDMKKAIAALSE